MLIMRAALGLDDTVQTQGQRGLLVLELEGVMGCVNTTLGLPGVVDPGGFTEWGWSVWKRTGSPGLGGCLLLWHLPFHMNLYKANSGCRCVPETSA